MQYESNFVLSLNIGSPAEMIEIRNPADSGFRAAIVRVGVTSESGFVVFVLKRYNSLATHGTAGNAPTQHDMYKWDPGAQASPVGIYTGTTGVHITWPNAGDVDYVHDFQLDPSDAGDDDRLQPAQYLTISDQIVVPQGCSASITMPAGQADYTVKLLLRMTRIGRQDVHQIVTLPDYLISAFGRLRIAEVVTLADLTNTYNIDPFDYSQTTATGGTITHVPAQSAIALAVTGSDGSRAMLRTVEAYRYQAGKPLLWMTTVALEDSGQTNQVRRWGKFDDNDGLFYQLSGTTISFVLRSSVSGSVVETTTTQANWNCDRLDGTGPSGVTLDVTKLHIYEARLTWLGVLGASGLQLYIDHINVHTEFELPAIAAPYMRTAQLPLTWEIVNTGASTGSSMTYVCAAVMSEGGSSPPEFSFAYQMPVEAAVGGTEIPLFSVRAGATFNSVVCRRSLMPALLTAQAEASRASFGIYWNAELTDATYAVDPDSSSCAEVDIAATAVTGGVCLARMFLAASSGQSLDLGRLFDVYGRKLRGGASDAVTITAICEQAGSTDVRATLSWREVRR